MRLIDADALRKQISETYEYEFPTASGGFDEFATKIIPNIINNAPTADIVPVVRGRWIVDDTVYCGAGMRWYKCTSCNERVFTAVKGSKGYRFCPNCGAKMDKEAQT